LLRRACGLLPGHRPAFEALLDLQRRERRWLQLADTWEEEIERLLGLEVPPPDRDLRVQKGLEELLAVCRDELGDLRWADRVAERLVNQVGGVRALVRRLGVLVASGVAGQGQGPPAALWAALAQAAGDEGVAARLRLFAAEAFLREGDRERARELAERAYQADVRGSTSSCAVALLERLAPSEDRRLAALEGELASLLQAGGQSAEVRTARFRLSSAALAAGAIERALAALEPLLAEGDPLACAWSWDVVRRLGKPALSTALLEAPTGRSEIDPSPRPLRAEAPADRGEAWERAGQADRAQASFAAALAEGFDADAALGLYRLAARSEDVAANVATLRQLAAGLEGEAREALAREAELLAAVAGLPSDSARTADALDATDARSEEERALLGWLQGVRRRDHRGTAEGLLGLAVLAAADEGTDAGAADAASGLLLRAVARARVAGPSHAAAVLARAWDYEPAEALLTPALSDLPLAKAALPDAGVIARQRRAATAPVDLAVSLLMEAAQACEEGGDGDGAVSLYGEVLARAPATLDALWALRRHAGERGDRHGWARVTVRLASVVRNRTRAATLWVEASSAWEDLGRIDEAIACLWQAVARVGATDEVSLRLPGLLETQGDDEGLETWLGHRLLRVTEPSARIALLWDRGSLRRDRLGKHDAAAADFKRILKLDPGHRPALEALAHLAEAAEAWDAAAHAWDRLLDRALRLAQPSLPLSLSLANALARAGDELRARQVLEEAIRAAPDEEAPREQLVGLLKMAGAWGEAIEGLQGLVERASTPARKAAFEEEIGVILLEQGRDPDAALAAFLRAGTSDPIGGGWDRALALAEASGREARDHVLASGLGLMRQAVQSTPLHVDLLRRFVGWLEKAARAVGPDERVRLAEEALTARQLLGVMGEEPSAPALGIGSGRGLAVPGFWNRLVPASAQGFALEIWPLLVDAAAELHPESTPRLPDVKRRRIAPQAEPSLAWIEALAVALGLPTLPIVFVAVPGAKAFAVELPEPTLCVSMDAPPRLDVPADRFAVGRALGLLHDRAAMLEALPPPQLVALFGAAAFVAGTRPTLVAPGAFKNLEGEAKRLGKAMSRKSRRALELEASRLGSENIDAEAFQQGLLATADRLGLLLAGDLGAALASRLATPPPLSVELLAHPALVPLVRFALSEEHILLRHEAGLGGEAK
jgi:tetratricopeptide (TPR) repeat protein